MKIEDCVIILIVFQSKFVAFYQYAKNFNSDCFNYEELKKTDYVFMRWKEHFLVPDHTIKDINGASFAGFYYICFQKSTSSIEGYYFHRNSEWFQSLNLTHVPDHSVQIYEFRWTIYIIPPKFYWSCAKLGVFEWRYYNVTLLQSSF